MSQTCSSRSEKKMLRLLPTRNMLEEGKRDQQRCLKRKLLTKESFSKKLITEEMMVDYLKLLNVSAETTCNTLDNIQQRSKRTATPLQAHERKRRHFGNTEEEEDDRDSVEIAQSLVKKLRLDMETDIPSQRSVSVTGNIKIVQPLHQTDTVTFAPSSNTVDSRVEPTSSRNTSLESNSDADTDEVEDVPSPFILPSLSYSPPSFTPSSPADASSLSSLVTENPHCFWIAPELKKLSTFNDSLLPRKVVNEIKSQGMELVPWIEPAQRLKVNQDTNCEEDKIAQQPAATTAG